MLQKKNSIAILFFLLCLYSVSGKNEGSPKISKNRTDLFLIGYNCYQNNKFAEASSCFFKAKNYYTTSGNYNKVVECLYYLSVIALKENRYADASKLLDEQSGLAENYKITHPLVLEGYYLKGNILLKEEKIAEAYSFFNKLIKELKQQRCADSTLAKIYHNKGTVEYYKGDFFNSLKSYEESVLHGTIAFGKNSLFVSDQINNLGVINFMLARFDEALRYYQESEKILQLTQNPDKNALAGTYTNIGLVFLDKNDLSNALLFTEKARDLYLDDQHHGHASIANTYINLAVIYDRLGSRNLQLENIKKALKYSEKQQPYLLPKIYFQMARYFDTMNQLAKTQYYLNKAVNKAKEIFGESSDLAYAHNNLGSFFINHNICIDQALKNFEAARDFFQNTIGFKHPSMASSYIHIGDYYEKTGQLEKALASYHTALLSISENYFNTDYLSFSYNTKSLATDYSIEILKDKARVIEKLAYKSADKKRKLIYLQNAFFHYKQAIRFIDQMRDNYFGEESRFILAENEQETYFQAIRIAYNLYQISGNQFYKENAFIIADNAHSASLQTMIREKLFSSKDHLNYPLLNSEMELKKELSTYNEWINREKTASKPDSVRIEFWKGKVTETTIKIEEVKNMINREHPSYRYLSYADNNFKNLEYIQKKLSDRESVMEYFLSDSVLYSFCITRKQADIRRIPINKSFFNNIEKVLSFVKYPTIVAADSLLCLQYRKAGNELYKILIEPFAAIIQNKSLIIVPDGKLTYLPFCTLLTRSTANETLNFKQLPYMVFKYPVRYIYASGLLNSSEKKHASKNLLAFAPVYKNNVRNQLADYNQTRDDQVVNLRYSSMEVGAIEKYIGGKALFSENASEENFKKDASEYRIIHLAMHASLNDDDPLNSKLIFTPHSSKTDDDFLYGYEIYNLKLNTDLMVLSACNTGTGKLRRGEGLMSLTRAFVFAGVKSIVMTLWSVNDRSGYSIMESFYHYLSQKKPKDIALQQSKLDYLRSADIIHAHPYYWAGFVIIGDNEAVDCKTFRFGYLIPLGLIIVMVTGIIYILLKRKTYKNLV